jgi:hypothetical protein
MKNKKFVSGTKDKKLLYFLGTLIACFLVYNYGISPAWEKAQEISQEAIEIDGWVASAHSAIASVVHNKEMDRQTLLELTEKYKPFIYELRQERIIYYLDTLAADAGLNVASYSQSLVSLETIAVPVAGSSGLQYSLLDDAAKINEDLKRGDAEAVGENVQDVNLSDDVIPATHVTLSFTGADYGHIEAFIKKIEREKRSIIVEEIEFRKVEGRLDGKIVLSLYSLPKLDPSESKELIFQPVLPLGKTNPFQ